MALVTCGDCGKSVSDSASACPFCGRPRVQPSAMTKPMGAPAVFVIIGVLLIAFDLFSNLAATRLTGIGVAVVIVGVVLIVIRLLTQD